VTYYFTLFQPRYRQPVDPVLMILASYLLWSGGDRSPKFEFQQTHTEL
jgi:hypothetical protein